VSPVRYELAFYIPQDGILHSYRRENLKCYMLEMSSLHVLAKNGHHQVHDYGRVRPRNVANKFVIIFE
jgi:hypothetical protein